MTYIVIDIETCPLNTDAAMAMQTEEERQKIINPIDSKIIAIGLRSGKTNKVWHNMDERTMLEEFWVELQSIKRGSSNVPIVGFNITSFDMPFIVTRSFIHNVAVSPFTLKELVDIREKISAYRYGPVRGKLKEFAQILGMPVQNVDGSNVMDLCLAGKWDEIRQYLERDLEITDDLYARTVLLNIAKISRW